MTVGEDGMNSTWSNCLTMITNHIHGGSKFVGRLLENHERVPFTLSIQYIKRKKVVYVVSM